MAAEVYFTKGGEQSMGSFRQVYGVLTASGIASGACKIMEYIAGGSVTSKSAATGGWKAKFNTGSGATALNGYLDINSGNAGDDFYVNVFGY